MKGHFVATAALAAAASLAVVPVTGAAPAVMSLTPLATPAKVQKMIRRSIQPALAENLGDGSTMTVTCKTTGRKTLRCVTWLIPGDKTMEKIRVIYGVACVSAVACRWTPIG